MLDLFDPLNNQKLTWKKPFSQHTFPPFVAFATAANNKPSSMRARSRAHVHYYGTML